MRRIEASVVVLIVGLLDGALAACGGVNNGDESKADAGSVGGSSIARTGAGGNAGGLGVPVGTGGTAGNGASSVKQGTAPPGCGDGLINQPSEECDDGNTLAGDGCNGVCRIEPNHVCPIDPNDSTRGLPCAVSFACGDGLVNPGEVCDQGKYQGNPGCSSDCKTQDPGYRCVAGQPCVVQYQCGNNRIETGETCDPPNPGAGCSATCQTESGWRCRPGSCSRLPYCGDGTVQADQGEMCDEGGFKGSPGCSADCLSKDTDCTCAPGKACVCPTPVCGDGIVQVSEQCDDRNSAFPGCSATCQLEPGYQCPFAGAPCVPVCGDGILVPPAEQCDPAANISNLAQACYSTATANAAHPACSLKPGWVCDATSCRQTVCGDGKVEGTEGCDPTAKNNDLGDGCTPTCMAEPSCPVAGGACTTKCGDGLVLGSEACDDGNAVNGDGCSSTCQVEAGFACSQPALGDTMVVPMVVRDFNAGGDFERGGVFESGHEYATQGLLKATLDVNGLKPVLASTTGTMNGMTGQDSGIASAQSFAQWYDDAATGPNPYRGTIGSSLDLFVITGSSPQAYVNRFGTNGDGLTNAKYQDFDGNPLFYPADAFAKPWSPDVQAQISGYFDPSVPTTPGTHNFSFTTEVRFWFGYDSTKTYKLSFVGDDDVWVFVNKHVAVDIGGIHASVQGVLTLTNGTATSVVTNVAAGAAVDITNTPNLGTLTNGGVYEIVVFQAERQTTASTYQLTLSGFNAAKSVCKPVCGGTNPAVSPGEQCDNGTVGNCDSGTADCYNKCTTTCTLGPRCGDGILQKDHEQCDNGKNADGYGASSTNACGPGCTTPKSCGDAQVQLDYGEECDNGSANSDTAYGGCTTKCKLGPSCGDGVLNGTTSHLEACDDGVNDGTYGTCSPGCAVPPRCGDGVVQSDWGEACEPTMSNDPSCTADCRLPGACGDGKVDPGELCDYGKALNNGDYGTCNSNCTLAPYCGDGVTNGPEQCDLGKDLNVGDYGGCTATCKLGPHCGDGAINGAEECDDGSANGSATSSCTTACKKYTGILI
jgi:fibro-slime domain-containing protein